jgi:hypothetical protein
LRVCHQVVDPSAGARARCLVKSRLAPVATTKIAPAPSGVRPSQVYSTSRTAPIVSLNCIMIWMSSWKTPKNSTAMHPISTGLRTDGGLLAKSTPTAPSTAPAAISSGTAYSRSSSKVSMSEVCGESEMKIDRRSMEFIATTSSASIPPVITPTIRPFSTIVAVGSSRLPRAR